MKKIEDYIKSLDEEEMKWLSMELNCHWYDKYLNIKYSARLLLDGIEQLRSEIE